MAHSRWGGVGAWRPGVPAFWRWGVFFVDCESGSGAPCARGTFRWGSGLVAREGGLGLGLALGGPCLALRWVSDPDAAWR